MSLYHQLHWEDLSDFAQEMPFREDLLIIYDGFRWIGTLFPGTEHDIADVFGIWEDLEEQAMDLLKETLDYRKTCPNRKSAVSGARAAVLTRAFWKDPSTRKKIADIVNRDIVHLPDYRPGKKLNIEKMREAIERIGLSVEKASTEQFVAWPQTCISMFFLNGLSAEKMSESAEAEMDAIYDVIDSVLDTTEQKNTFDNNPLAIPMTCYDMVLEELKETLDDLAGKLPGPMGNREELQAPSSIMARSAIYSYVAECEKKSYDYLRTAREYPADAPIDDETKPAVALITIFLLVLKEVSDSSTDIRDFCISPTHPVANFLIASGCTFNGDVNMDLLSDSIIETCCQFIVENKKKKGIEKLIPHKLRELLPGNMPRFLERVFFGMAITHLSYLMRCRDLSDTADDDTSDHLEEKEIQKTSSEEKLAELEERLTKANAELARQKKLINTYETELDSIEQHKEKSPTEGLLGMNEIPHPILFIGGRPEILHHLKRNLPDSTFLAAGDEKLPSLSGFQKVVFLITTRNEVRNDIVSMASEKGIPVQMIEATSLRSVIYRLRADR